MSVSFVALFGIRIDFSLSPLGLSSRGSRQTARSSAPRRVPAEADERSVGQRQRLPPVILHQLLHRAEADLLRLLGAEREPAVRPPAHDQVRLTAGVAQRQRVRRRRAAAPSRAHQEGAVAAALQQSPRRRPVHAVEPGVLGDAGRWSRLPGGTVCVHRR